MNNNDQTAGQTTQTQPEWHHTDSSRPPMTCGRISRYLKGEGRGALLGHIGTVVGATLLYYGIVLVLNVLVDALVPYTLFGVLLGDLLSIILGILFGVLEYGLISIYMNLQYGQMARFTDLFIGFQENSNKIIIIQAILILIETACMLPASLASLFASGTTGWIAAALLLAAGYVLAFFFNILFALSLYILLDYPDMPWKDVLKRSVSLMKGYKKYYLYLELSFLPLYLLSVLTLGVAAILVSAYEQSTLAAFYKGRMENRLMG